MFDICIAAILAIYGVILKYTDHTNWSRIDYSIYYLLWFVVAFFGTYGFVNELFY